MINVHECYIQKKINFNSVIFNKNINLQPLTLFKFVNTKSKKMNLKKGDNAPSFKLFNSEKTEISLSDYAGKNLLILFFPQAFTGTCTTELCAMRDGIAEYNALNADIVAISVDSLFTLAKFKEDQKLNFTMLSDFNKNVSEAYGCLYDEFVFGMKGVSKRSAFVVDKNGVIQYAEVLEKAPDLPNFEAIKQVLATLH
jgi:peroxiredoxin